jgi:hypothetical protein
MSKILCFLAFIIWLTLTLFLTITIIGLFVILDDDSYFNLGKNLVIGIKRGEQ